MNFMLNIRGYEFAYFLKALIKDIYPTTENLYLIEYKLIQ